MTTNFDLEDVYDEKIAPLMTQIIAIAKEHGMPILFSAVYRHDENDTLCCTTYDHPPERVIPKFHECIATLTRPAFTAFAITVTKGKP